MSDDTRSSASEGCGSGCGCGPRDATVSRRAFLSATGVVAISALMGPKGAVAGPFDAAEDFPIPADKKWDPAWVKALFDRGEPRAYRSSRRELEFIGMPIGGICCGQVYLSGDGRLWHWDVFNTLPNEAWRSSSGPLYAHPAAPASPIEQGVVLRVITEAGARERPLDARGFQEVTFRGQWPVGLVEYRDPASSIDVDLEAFSPTSPLDVTFSSVPATVMRYTLRNRSETAVDVELVARLSNGVCLESGEPSRGWRVDRIREERDFTAVVCSAEPAPAARPSADRPDIVVADFESGTYAGWTVTGTAFGKTPRTKQDVARYQSELEGAGQWFVNSHEVRNGEDVARGDAHVGALESIAFRIERDWLSFRIGGGNHPGKTCVNLVSDGVVVRTATGRDENRMRVLDWDVRDLAGRSAIIQIVDAVAGPWGNIGCDDFVLTDRPRSGFDLRAAADFGTMSVAVIGDPSSVHARVGDGEAREARTPFPATSTGFASRRIKLAAGGVGEAVFVFAWHFPTPRRAEMAFLADIGKRRRHYATSFEDAFAVVRHVVTNLDAITHRTRLWRDTWYDSTLPHWFLDRTMANTSTLATSTCHLFDDGRFYAWEGTHCCPGTCTHVWHYAQAVGRLFPQLERSLRERVDFGAEFEDASGIVHYRGEAGHDLAVDGQSGVILRFFREHQMSSSDAMLRRTWPRVKRAVECLLERDTDGDGLLDGAQYNTLDATWWGQIAWTSSLFIAALRAAAAMATEVGNGAFASRCSDRADRGSRAMVERLFDGDYFIHLTDAKHPEANSTGTGCHIDQLLGQFWAHQLGLPRVVPKREAVSALRSLYRYGVAPDVGPYRKRFDATLKGGRWYAMPGEGGLLMCTWPKGGETAATGKGGEAWAAGYFNECMSGFEHQAAAHMISEGLVLEGLAVTRLIHDRYDASRRNPWNEVECSNHYARAMASYGTFIAACGFEFHGPSGRIGFSPKLTPERFRAAFVCAEGFGTFAQEHTKTGMTASLLVRWGSVALRTIVLEPPIGSVVSSVSVRLGDRTLPATVSSDAGRVSVTLADRVTVRPSEALAIALT